MSGDMGDLGAQRPRVGDPAQPSPLDAGLGVEGAASLDAPLADGSAGVDNRVQERAISPRAIAPDHVTRLEPDLLDYLRANSIVSSLQIGEVTFWAIQGLGRSPALVEKTLEHQTVVGIALKDAALRGELLGAQEDFGCVDEDSEMLRFVTDEQRAWVVERDLPQDVPTERNTIMLLATKQEPDGATVLIGTAKIHPHSGDFVSMAADTMRDVEKFEGSSPFLYLVTVDPREDVAGVTTKLVGQAVELAKQRGWPGLIKDLPDDPPAALADIYRANGFARVSGAPGYDNQFPWVRASTGGGVQFGDEKWKFVQ
jgi:hypothetical protein